MNVGFLDLILISSKWMLYFLSIFIYKVALFINVLFAGLEIIIFARILVVMVLEGDH